MSELPFPHHTYLQTPDEGDYLLVPASDAAPTAPEAPLRAIAERLRRFQVKTIYLIHGTFAGNDLLGLVREVSRISPGMAQGLRQQGKRWFDHLAGEVGNYTARFAEDLSSLVNVGDEHPIDVRTFHWSGENHHLGRAAGAVELLDELFRHAWQPEDRVLCWAHSHGGNLLAMLSLLLGARVDTVRKFFRATRSHYREPIFGHLDLPVWDRVRKNLLRGRLRPPLPQIDVVTFGTPLRYRWNNEVCRNLLHVVQHRVLDANYPSLASVPRSLHQILQAEGGDYVQQLGIGGTDFLHSLLAFRSWVAEHRLRKMFASGVRRRDVRMNLARRLRVSLDGKTLLVDYPETPEQWQRKLAGHGVYTRVEWAPFHLQQTVDTFYSPTDKPP